MFKNLQWYLLTHAKEDCIQLTMMGTGQTRICSKTERLCSLYNVQEQVKKKKKKRCTEKVVQTVGQQMGKY